jgi:hypothetical protein
MVLLITIWFFVFILLFPFVLAFLVISVREPRLLSAAIYIIGATLSFFYEKIIEGIDLWIELPNDPKAYDSLFIHFLRYALLAFIIIFSMILTYSFFYLCAIFCCDYNDSVPG